jgi:hypothetical protein
VRGRSSFSKSETLTVSEVVAFKGGVSRTDDIFEFITGAGSRQLRSPELNIARFCCNWEHKILCPLNSYTSQLECGGGTSLVQIVKVIKDAFLQRHLAWALKFAVIEFGSA